MAGERLVGVGRYILARLALAIPMLLILLTVVFLIPRVIPGDPCLAMQGSPLREHFPSPLCKDPS